MGVSATVAAFFVYFFIVFDPFLGYVIAYPRSKPTEMEGSKWGQLSEIRLDHCDKGINYCQALIRQTSKYPYGNTRSVGCRKESLP